MKNLSSEKEANPLPRAYEAWAQWVGLSSQMTLALASEATKRCGDLLNEVERHLWTPPDPESTSYCPEHLVPKVDLIFNELASHLKQSPTAFWPNQQPYALCVTHDIDRIFSTIHGLRGFFRKPMKSIKRVAQDLISTAVPPLRSLNGFYNFSRLQEIEERWKIHSAAYVLFEKRRWVRALRTGQWQHALGVYRPRAIAGELKSYLAGGNEVGLHASFDAWNEKNALSQELEAITHLGLPRPCGVRNHYLNFDVLRTPEIQATERLSYDSSVGFNYSAGFPTGTCFPYRLGKIWELPMQLMDTSLRSLEQEGVSPREVCRKTLDAVKRAGGVLVLNWHTQFLNRNYFSESVGWLEEIVGEAKRDKAWITVPKELIAWWEKRRPAPR